MYQMQCRIRPPVGEFAELLVACVAAHVCRDDQAPLLVGEGGLRAGGAQRGGQTSCNQTCGRRARNLKEGGRENIISSQIFVKQAHISCSLSHPHNRLSRSLSRPLAHPSHFLSRSLTHPSHSLTYWLNWVNIPGQTLDRSVMNEPKPPENDPFPFSCTTCGPTVVK